MGGAPFARGDRGSGESVDGRYSRSRPCARHVTAAEVPAPPIPPDQAVAVSVSRGAGPAPAGGPPASGSWTMKSCGRIRTSEATPPTRASTPAISSSSFSPLTKAPRAAAPVVPAVWVARIEPRAATLVAIPTWRKVLLMPEAIPAWRGSTTPTAVEASGGVNTPPPGAGAGEAGGRGG